MCRVTRSNSAMTSPIPHVLKAAKAKINAREKKETESGGAPLVQDDCMVAAYGKIDGIPTVILVQDFAFMGGSLGMAAGEAFITAAHMALARKAAFVVCTASGGARMQEGTSVIDADAAHDAGHQ